MNKVGILVIEDDREMCEELAEILRLEGYSVEKAYDGIEGMKLVDSRNYDMVLLDLKLPGFDGADLLRHIKKNTSVPVIVITGKPITSELQGILEPEDEKDLEALKLADGFAEKPFNIKAVLGAIRELKSTGGAPVSPEQKSSGKPRKDA